METIKVQYRAGNDGEPVAVFPEIPWNAEGDVTTYVHIGQHGGGDLAFLEELPLSTEKEWIPLHNELVSIGYGPLGNPPVSLHVQNHELELETVSATLADDGTMDTVIETYSERGGRRTYRYTYQPDEGFDEDGNLVDADGNIEQDAQSAYDEFVEWCIEDARETHLTDVSEGIPQGIADSLV